MFVSEVGLWRPLYWRDPAERFKEADLTTPPDIIDPEPYEPTTYQVESMHYTEHLCLMVRQALDSETIDKPEQGEGEAWELYYKVAPELYDFLTQGRGCRQVAARGAAYALGLSNLVDGKNQREQGRELNVSHSTVWEASRRLKKKLGWIE